MLIVVARYDFGKLIKFYLPSLTMYPGLAAVPAVKLLRFLDFRLRIKCVVSFRTHNSFLRKLFRFLDLEKLKSTIKRLLELGKIFDQFSELL